MTLHLDDNRINFSFFFPEEEVNDLLSEEDQNSQIHQVTFGLDYLRTEKIYEQDYQESLGVKIWRHTAGRIGRFALVIVNSLGAFFELTKALIKLPFVAVTFNLTKHIHYNISAEGIFDSLESVIYLAFSENINHLKGVFAGPDKNGYSFQYETLTCFNHVFRI